MNKRIKYPFFSAIVLSSIIYGEFKMLNSYVEKNENKINDSIVSEEGKKEDNEYATYTLKSDEHIKESISVTETDENTKEADNIEETQTVEATELVTQAKAPEITNETDKTYEFTQVDISYLDDALFIGDSRTSTLYEYAGWDNTDFYVEYGLTIWDVLDAPIASMPGSNEKISVYDGLSAKKYGKIYIMLGVNELGTGTADTYFEQFKTVISTIRELQPDAVIFIQSIMHVTDEIDHKGTYINNDEINARNDKIKTLADNKNVFYIDNNQLFDDPQTGKLNPDYTADGVHILARYVGDWQNFYLEHGIIK